MERIVGDLKLFELKTMHLLVTLRDHVDHRPSLVRAARIAVNDVTCQSQDDLVSAVPGINVVWHAPPVPGSHLGAALLANLRGHRGADPDP